MLSLDYGIVSLLSYALFVAPLFGIFSALLAEQKNRSALGWFAVGFFFGPFGLLVAAFSEIEGDNEPNTVPQTPLNYNIVDMVAKGMRIDHIGTELNEPVKSIKKSCERLLQEGEITERQFATATADVLIEGETPENKKCPFCAEEIKFEAIKCKHCGSDITNNNGT